MQRNKKLISSLGHLDSKPYRRIFISLYLHPLFLHLSPLVALIRESSGTFECKFVLATISLEFQENEPETIEQNGDEHVSGTEDELDI